MRSMSLIGMPGSGKSSVGRILAARLGWNFLDTDLCIEERHGMALQALINRVGDQSFRCIEEETMLSLAPGEPAVISTGGSVIYSERGMQHLASLSAVIFLDATLEAIRSRIAAEAPRGIVGMTDGGLERLYQERLPYYRRYASLTVTLDCETPDEAATKILSELACQ